MRKLLVVMLALVMGFGVWATPAWADDADVIKAYYNGTEIAFDQPPVIEEGRTLVPARAILETLGLELDYNAETGVVTAKNNEMVIILTIDSTVALVNDEEKVLDVPARIMSDRTMVPLRFISETMNMDVQWDEVTRTININSKVVEPEPVVTEDDFSGDNYLNFPTVLNYIKYAGLTADDYTVVTNGVDTLQYQFAFDATNEEQTELLVEYYNGLIAAEWNEVEVANDSQAFETAGLLMSFTPVEGENFMVFTIEKVAVDNTDDNNTDDQGKQETEATNTENTEDAGDDEESENTEDDQE